MKRRSSNAQALLTADRVPAQRFVEFVCADPAVRQVIDLVRQVADTNATVLITGETGTGKEMIARMLHDLSGRRGATFVAVNCGAVVDSLVESDLFGHVKGAFTGASGRHVGRFEAAHGGTVFLDEVAEATRGFQVKLLRILQAGEYTPVGSSVALRCDVRVIAATNRPLRPLADAGEFRADLYYRLNVIRLDLPPLRDRPADIPPLIDHFLKHYREAYARPAACLVPEAQALLARYSFPGNVRELENIVLRAVVLCRGGAIRPEDLPPEVRDTSGQAGSEPRRFHAARAEMIEHFEREFLTRALRMTGGIINRAALLAGLSERNFHVKLRKYGVSGKSFRAGIETD